MAAIPSFFQPPKNLQPPFPSTLAPARREIGLIPGKPLLGSVLMLSRHQARRRQRRLIFNNDGNDLAPSGPRPADQAVDPQTFLEARTAPLADSQVDSIFYCDGTFNLYSHRSDESEFFDRQPDPDHADEPTWRIGSWAPPLVDQGHEPLQLVQQWCREQRRECFWSFRMNDLHDSSREWLRSEWKRGHPELLMGSADGYPRGGGALVNYSETAVQEKVVRIWRDVLGRYDLDGIELDFFRHPILFRSQKEGQPVTPDERDHLTGMMAELRRTADECARRTGRPCLIALRIPDSVGYCQAMGIDLIRWLEADWIDILVGGDYFRLEPWENFAALGQRYEVPTYACIVERRLMQGEGLHEATRLPLWRAEAKRAWEGGVDGIYIFNRFNPGDAVFRELGDPDLLRELPSEGKEFYAADASSWYLNPGHWLKDGRSFLRAPDGGGDR